MAPIFMKSVKIWIRESFHCLIIYLSKLYFKLNFIQLLSEDLALNPADVTFKIFVNLGYVFWYFFVAPNTDILTQR